MMLSCIQQETGPKTSWIPYARCRGRRKWRRSKMPTNTDTVLQVLRDQGTLTSKEIVERTGLSKRAVSVAIGRLVEDGNATRSTDGAVTAKEKKK
jgi:hypothetical protein